MKKEDRNISYRDLAERFYELDTDVYETSGSEMGKVFPGVKHISVKQIIDDLKKGDMDKIKQEMILVRNMLQTLAGHERYEEMMAEFERLKEDFRALAEDEDKVREQITKDFTDDKFGLMYKGEKDHLVICIARQTGAGGHEVGFRLAERLGIGFYDDNIIDLMMEELEDNYRGLGSKDAHYIKQSKVITNIARTEDCVIVGRSCGHVLMQQNIPRLSAFIGAPLENRIRRKMLLNGQDRKAAEDLVKKTDKARKNAYNYYTGKKWGHASDFDICINTACYGIEGAVELLEHLVEYSLNKNA